MQKQITTIIDRFEGAFAVLKCGEREILWAKEDLPEDVREGDSIVITASDSEAETDKHHEEAKEAIDDIINDGLNKQEKS